MLVMVAFALGELNWLPTDIGENDLALSVTNALHRYAFTRDADGREKIATGVGLGTQIFWSCFLVLNSFRNY